MRRSIFLILPTCLVLASCSGGAERATAGDATSGSRAEAAATQPTAHPTGSAGERVSFGDISFEVPPAWEPRRPSSRMRVAQYAIPAAGADSGEVECGLFHFPGQGGTVGANLQRWYGQFVQPDGKDTADTARVDRFNAGGLAVTVVRVAGTYTASGGPTMRGGVPRPDYGMVAGVIETGGGPWFLKCVGPETTVRAAAPGIRAALSTVRGG